MFSGLIAYRGAVVALEGHPHGGATLAVRCEGAQAERAAAKDSIAIDGVCLTATAVDGEIVSFDVVPETLARSTLGERVSGEMVNVEYSLRVGDRLGGHLVYGHVDAAARILLRTSEGNGERLRLETPASLGSMIAPKGFVALDGVSITVAAAGREWFEVALIPETLARTTLGARLPGSRVNLEIDPLARYTRHVILSLSKDESHGTL
ncbi:MAG: riboflavin synthase [Candidatus Eremiobacteraeota bacterium]|nr:riboflavin synthase [Candidatus Eremiobacteraeota bacterium]